MLLLQKKELSETKQSKSILNGMIEQDLDLKTDGKEDLKVVTKKAPTSSEINALLFASKICKHTKSNTIVLANEGSVAGQWSRANIAR